MIHEEDRNSVDEDDRKPPAKEMQKELRRSPRVPNSWRIGYNEESDSDEDVEGEGRERCLVSTSKADSERTLHLTDQTDDLDNNSGRQHERNKSWDAIYHQLVQFKKEHGHCNVPFKTPKLGYWVATQRRDCKDSNRIEKLNRLGFSWNARDDSWIEMFEELKEFKRINGHLKIRSKSVLGKWVSRQRIRCKDPIRRGKLDSIGFIWDVLENQWQEKYNELVEFKKRHGHCEVHYKYGPLGIWCNDMRMRGCNPARHEKLTKLGFRWITRKMMTTAPKIIEKKTMVEKTTTVSPNNNGHCEVQNSVVPPGTWYIDQRERKRIKPVRGEKVVMNFRMHTGDTMKKNQAHKKPPKKTPPKKKVTATKRVIIETVKRSARI